MIGTLINVAAILLGGLIGMIVRSHLPERFMKIIFQSLGLVTIAIGVSMTLESKNLIISVISIVVGSVIGELINIEKRLEHSANYLKSHMKFKTDRFSEGFVTASMLYCVGSMAILGAIEDGTGHMPRLLLTKSLMDGASSIAFGATFGIGVLFSAIPVLIYQGFISIFAGFMSSIMVGHMIAELTAVGGLMLIGMGIKILKIKNIAVTNMLPSLLISIILGFLFS